MYGTMGDTVAFAWEPLHQEQSGPWLILLDYGSDDIINPEPIYNGQAHILMYCTVQATQATLVEERI